MNITVIAVVTFVFIEHNKNKNKKMAAVTFAEQKCVATTRERNKNMKPGNTITFSMLSENKASILLHP